MTVSEQIIQVLDALCEKFGMAIDWTNDNVIPYVTTLCTKLIAYEIWTSVAWMAIMIGLCVLGGLVYRAHRQGLKENLDDFDHTVVTTLIYIGLTVLYLSTIICVGCQIMDIVKCVTFPEMYVFEYVQALINGGANG